MSELTRPLILVLDPDHDYLEAMERLAANREVKLVALPYSIKNKGSLEELVSTHFPDIIVINLDQDSELDFANPVTEIRSIPLPVAPIILGTTVRAESQFKQKAYALGIDDYVMRPFTPFDLWLRLDVMLRIRKLQQQLGDATRSLSILNVQLSDSNRRLEEMTLTDELTGLYNMRFMIQFLEKQYELIRRYDRPFSIMMLDLDHFKSVNDRNDHLVGSAAIKAIGQVIEETTRRSDVKARYGGDEYIIAMPETDEAAAKLAGERLRAAIERRELLGNEGVTFKITGSIGVATHLKDHHKTYTDLVKDADAAMYRAKESGRNRVHFFDGKKDGYDDTQSSVLTEIKKAEKKRTAT